MLKNSFNYSGRASVKEFSSFLSMNLLAIFIMFIIAYSLKSSVVIEAYTAFTFLTLISVTIRRLHDLGKSGWWIWTALIPFGVFYLYIICNREGTGENRFGQPVV